MSTPFRCLLLALTVPVLAACQPADPPDDASPAAPPQAGPVEAASSDAAESIAYPATGTVAVVDTYHGVEVADPYRWLEQDVRESDDVAAWVAAQNEVTDAYLDTLAAREYFTDRLQALWDYERFGSPVERGGTYFFTRNDGLQDQSVLYAADGLDAEPRVLIDPNRWSDDGTVSLAHWVPSPDGRFVAYGIQDGGSDWRTWRVLDVASGEVLDDELNWLKFTSVAWRPDGSGFYYSRYPAPESGAEFQSLNLDQKVYFHALGDVQADDALIHERPDQPEWGFQTAVSHDGRYLVITVFHGTDNRYRVAYKDLEDPAAEVVTLIDEFAHDYSFISHRDGEFLFFTNDDAPRYRVVAIALNEPATRREIIPESEHVMQGAADVGGRLAASYLVDAKSALRVFELDGTPVGEVELPGIGSLGGFSGKPTSNEAFFSFSSFNRPPTLYRYDVATGERSAWRSAEVDFDPEAYTVRQVFYRSADGTRVPMFIAHRRDVTPDGTTPTLLYGYGGFNISLTPSFAVQNLAWMEAGGVYAMANLRGGGEYGREWHQAGTRTTKQNVFDDFIAAAEYLVDEGITSPEHLGIYGRSNGGLLVGATINQRPELFAAALPAVGVLDMLRFNQFTAGRFWVDDYGTPDNAEEFRALHAYSPVHNVAAGRDYPAVLITTADTDDRVVPSHSFKYAAALQAVDTGTAPTLIRIETRAGHGAGTPVSMLVDLYADQWAFLAEHTGLTPRRAMR
ncbi:S9 family peptidase [Wenzhouxiangella sp. XN79A]|uniref:prolyl oligopeptidase family serine peptidase n=1 Tax=Wenzhouxiangella sp. XN79A TaxID=2724193 RepID=UPI00144AF2A2|nr:prolyl oligopeptidase family serine peptidase [Wenzhouxiangella sp. XN79A]NKI33654.1 S9 family peptidase [Wenzhouxiangella sp. XN79A]